ncbi:MAG: bacterial transcriptional activator domain-containing protein [Gammaproteobacteria bacterium]
MARKKSGERPPKRQPSPSVKIRTLGMFRIAIDGEDALPTGHGCNKPLQLLQLLLALNPDGTTVQALSDALWPDAEADAAHHAFEVNLQRLRRVLGRPDALLLHAGTLRLNRAICQVDNWTLDAVVRQLDAESLTEPPEVLARRVLQVCRGLFLPDVDASWALLSRQKLAARFLRVVEQLGGRLEASGQADLAVDLYRRALESDPVAESVCRRLMAVLATAGRQTEALAAYARCADACAAGLGVPPSDLTRNQADAIRNSLR